MTLHGRQGPNLNAFALPLRPARPADRGTGGLCLLTTGSPASGALTAGRGVGPLLAGLLADTTVSQSSPLYAVAFNYDL